MGRAKGLCAVMLLMLAWSAGAHAADKNVGNGKGAAAPAGDVIGWMLPWREGVTLRYATEDYDDEQDGDSRERTRITGIETVSIREAREDGYLQEWSFADTRFEVLEGEPAGVEVTQGLMESLGDLVLEVELDGEGNYQRIRNLTGVAARMRPVMKEAMVAATAAALDAEFAAAAPGDAEAAADPTVLQAARSAALQTVDGMVERLTSPEVLERLLSEDAVRYNDFVGVELEDGREYEIDVDLDNPLSGGSLPARVTFGIHLRESDPDDVFLEWTTRVDPAKAAEAARHFLGMLLESMPEEARAQLPAELSIIESGFVLFRRSTGVVEMLEATRTVRAAGQLKVERRRMRLLDDDHRHEWAGDDAPTPAEEPADAA
ncbi:hypothetical protein [Luteimonas sp. MC1828]|uniref:hypothetical protein n=1 Tax=Luteimonas sp. MC1828 TaxID=2799787 RepID=UPI0018F19B66|nr:hypothetical protein [Luteimonas sp. MC1828]MBJ7575857.1 hypothetical protein [Luteimonas sp. MC1828]